MQVTAQIDNLIHNLNSLKHSLTDDTSSNTNRFSNILASSLELFSESENRGSKLQATESEQISSPTPSWVDKDFHYNPLAPRKPNMRELMEAISGKSVEELYADKANDWRAISHVASELLYGVIGPKLDTRDWNKILSSQNILYEARKQTSELHQPVLDVATIPKSNYQYAVIKDSSGTVLREVIGSTKTVEATLLNFGLSVQEIPSDFEKRFTSGYYDSSVIQLLKERPVQKNLQEELVTNDIFSFESQYSKINDLSSDLSHSIPAEEFIKL